jgi:hypothetical protein
MGGDECDHERIVGEEAGRRKTQLQSVATGSLGRLRAQGRVRAHPATECHRAAVALFCRLEKFGDEDVGDGRLE